MKEIQLWFPLFLLHISLREMNFNPVAGTFVPKNAGGCTFSPVCLHLLPWSLLSAGSLKHPHCTPCIFMALNASGANSSLCSAGVACAWAGFAVSALTQCITARNQTRIAKRNWKNHLPSLVGFESRVHYAMLKKALHMFDRSSSLWFTAR